MAGSLLVLLDDIATVLDDVAAMTKVAAKKTAGVLGDDLALNAKQLTGVRPAREIAVVLRVARGSALNKLVLVPAALVIAWAAPWAIAPLLVVGGAFLCYEGAEKLLHRFLHHNVAARGGKDSHAIGKERHHAAEDERQRVATAVRTDFILSAEIIVIALGVVAGRPFLTQVAVLTLISIAMTVGVYGLVAGIVKLDDLGALLATRKIWPFRTVGRGILIAAPWLMRGLSASGTAAMFLVGGGIIAHAVPAAQHVLHEITHGSKLPLLAHFADALVGLAVGLLLVGAKTSLSHAAKIDA